MWFLKQLFGRALRYSQENFFPILPLTLPNPYTRYFFTTWYCIIWYACIFHAFQHWLMGTIISPSYPADFYLFIFLVYMNQDKYRRHIRRHSFYFPRFILRKYVKLVLENKAGVSRSCLNWITQAWEPVTIWFGSNLLSTTDEVINKNYLGCTSWRSAWDNRAQLSNYWIITGWGVVGDLSKVFRHRKT